MHDIGWIRTTEFYGKILCKYCQEAVHSGEPYILSKKARHCDGFRKKVCHVKCYVRHEEDKIKERLQL